MSGLLALDNLLNEDALETKGSRKDLVEVGDCVQDHNLTIRDVVANAVYRWVWVYTKVWGYTTIWLAACLRGSLPAQTHGGIIEQEHDCGGAVVVGV
jgi:hypothetical protein